MKGGENVDIVCGCFVKKVKFANQKAKGHQKPKTETKTELTTNVGSVGIGVPSVGGASVGNGVLGGGVVGRTKPGVGARVLLVPASTMADWSTMREAMAARMVMMQLVDFIVLLLLIL